MRHSEWMLDPDAENVAAPKLECGSEIREAVPPAPGASSASPPFPRPLPGAGAELCELIVLQRGGRQVTSYVRPSPSGARFASLTGSGPSALPTAPGSPG